MQKQTLNPKPLCSGYYVMFACILYLVLFVFLSTDIVCVDLTAADRVLRAVGKTGSSWQCRPAGKKKSIPQIVRLLCVTVPREAIVTAYGELWHKMHRYIYILLEAVSLNFLRVCMKIHQGSFKEGLTHIFANSKE